MAQPIKLQDQGVRGVLYDTDKTPGRPTREKQMSRRMLMLRPVEGPEGEGCLYVWSDG